MSPAGDRWVISSPPGTATLKRWENCYEQHGMPSLIDQFQTVVNYEMIEDAILRKQGASPESKNELCRIISERLLQAWRATVNSAHIMFPFDEIA